ncbi:MAG: sulfate ABC transporter permease subunit CysT, partial [Microcystis panniformis]
MANPQLSLSPSQTLKKVSIPWVITISYLVVLLVLPAAALFAKSLTLGFA